jgi:hypothetical protein
LCFVESDFGCLTGYLLYRDKVHTCLCAFFVRHFIEVADCPVLLFGLVCKVTVFMQTMPRIVLCS